MLRGNVSNLSDLAGSQANDSCIKAMSSSEGRKGGQGKQNEYQATLSKLTLKYILHLYAILESLFTKTSLKREEEAK